MLSTLNAVGPRKWIERDHDTFGEYISTHLLDDPHRGSFSISVEADHYVVNVSSSSNEPNPQPAFDAVFATLFS